MTELFNSVDLVGKRNDLGCVHSKNDSLVPRGSEFEKASKASPINDPAKSNAQRHWANNELPSLANPKLCVSTLYQ